MIVSQVASPLVRDESALERAEADADDVDVALEQIGQFFLPARGAAFPIGHHDQITVAVVGLTEAFQRGVEHAVVIGTALGHVVRIEAGKELTDDLVVRAHGDLHERSAGEHDQAHVLALEIVEQFLNHRFCRIQACGLIRHVLGPHAARQIEGYHDLAALTEGLLGVLAPLRARQRNDSQRNGSDDCVRSPGTAGGSGADPVAARD